MKYDRYERVNFEHERRKIFKLYRGTGILRRRQQLEHRVIQSLGLLLKSDARYPFVAVKSFFRVDRNQ